MDSDTFEQDETNDKPKRGVNDDKPKRGLNDDEIGGAPMPDSGSGVYVPVRGRSGCRWPVVLALGCLGACMACCVLPLCALAITGAGFAAILSNSEATQSGTQTVALEPDAIITLAVDSTVGAITIEPGSGDAVEVAYTKKAYGLTKGQAQNELDNIKLDVTQPSSDHVEVTVKNDRTKDSFWSFANKVDMTIAVPASLNVEVKSDVGSITIQNVQARSLDISTSTGSINFDGSLQPGASSQYKIETNTGAITVTLPHDSYVRMDAKSDVGSVSVSDGFDSLSDVKSERQTVGASWTGTLGTGTEVLPVLTLHTDTGSISVQAH